MSLVFLPVVVKTALPPQFLSGEVGSYQSYGPLIITAFLIYMQSEYIVLTYEMTLQSMLYLHVLVV